MQTPRNFLIIADSGFHQLCVDPSAYLTKLKELLLSAHPSFTICTVSGRYGVSDPHIPVLAIEDRNKTMFVQTIENLSFQCDELIVVSVVNSDPFIDALVNNMTQKHTCIRRYKYGVK